MKCIFLILAHMAITCSTATAQAIKNGNFEEPDALFWKFLNPSSFGAADAGYVFSIESDELDKHGKVARLKSVSNSKWAQVKQVLAYKPTGPLQKLRLHADIKLTGLNSGTAGVSVRAFGKKGSQGLFEKTLSGDTGWVTVHKDFIVTNTTDSLAIFCSLTGMGEAMYDNIWIETITGSKIEQSPVAKAYLDTVLTLIKENALYKDSVNYDELVSNARLLAADAKTTSDCYTAIKFILSGLKDHHSFFQTPQDAKFLNREEANEMALPEGNTLNGEIGYLKVPACMALSAAMEKVYADSLTQVIRTIDNNNITGWIVDVRDNTGGNCWPMLLGLGPVLGEGIFDRKYKDGKLADSIGYWAGVVKGTNAVIIKTANPYSLNRSNAKVALLMNGMTASSGETVVLGFKNRQNTKIFGEPSYGLTTGNLDVELSDGAMIFICKAKQTDRLGNEYGGKIFPDVPVKDDKNTKQDEVINTAVSWLKEAK